ncbi:MotA/TolQ/ExbB proton channel family protein [Parvularcula sp. IMCC14364]|uniref:MotA/TolQ/ExbB proton channel family protein n=1 Tax=Parvularcula sp. IMCC14364 TaxID=3067902 RepID=UPI002740BB88|nr:MotA/TolQ/ExbB proton channel family protein [Parvularcula sp. IMCC14364]
MLEVLNPVNAYDSIREFLQAGGDVLFAIMIATFIMWALILERVIFFTTASAGVRKQAVRAWSNRKDHASWYALAVRDKLLSEVKLASTQNITVIKGLVAIAPLLGLLGTVTGMVEVFNVMAVTGSSNARLMAGGISKATIPTMAGLVASLSGILMLNILEARARATVRDTSEELDKTVG